MAHAEEGEYNEKDMAAYAACVNSLAVEYGVPTILWDCSVHVNRKELRVNYPSYVDAIMGCYPDHAAGNGGDNAVFEEETALAAAANFGPGWNLGNTLDSTSYHLNDVNAGKVGWIVQWGKKDAQGNLLPEAWETAWGSPTFMALRQKAFDMEYTVQVTSLAGSEGGVTVYGTESEHYDLFLRRTETGCQAVLKMNIGGIRHEQAVLPLDGNTAELVIRSTSTEYRFFVRANGEEHFLGTGQSKFLSNEVSTTFTGVMLGLFAQGKGETRFDNLHIHYTF